VAELPGSLQGRNDGLRLFAVDCVMVLDLLLWMAACWMVVSLCSGLLDGWLCCARWRFLALHLACELDSHPVGYCELQHAMVHVSCAVCLGAWIVGSKAVGVF